MTIIFSNLMFDLSTSGYLAPLSCSGSRSYALSCLSVLF